jgi:hypothetical protein
METRSSPSMQELRDLAHERGLKYYMHLSKPELFSLLQRKEGGGSSKPATSTVSSSPEAKTDAVRNAESTPEPAATRSSERLSFCQKKRKTRDDEAETPKDIKKAKVAINSLDPIMLTELGPHRVSEERGAGAVGGDVLTRFVVCVLFVQFEFTRTNGSVVVYNVETLVQYILATGDFSEPETRIPFSDEDLRRIDSEVDIPVSCAPSG